MRESITDRNFWIARHLLPHEPALRRYLERQRLPTNLDVDDIVQEVYGRFAEMESVDAVRDARTFMLGVGRNVMLEALRRARVVSIRSADDLGGFEIAADEPSPEDYASDREQLHLLALAVSRIKEPWRTAFLLRVIDELPHREIGLRLGMSENAVQKSHAKTIIKLMRMLGRGGNDAAGATGVQHQVTSEERNEQN
jgi:RNA polymerase sigma factor (sigma-70 family)